MAHEIAHVYLLHFGLFAAAYEEDVSFKMLVSSLGAAFISEMFEMEADYMAIMAAGRAGYSPLAMALFLSRISQGEVGRCLLRSGRERLPRSLLAYWRRASTHRHFRLALRV